MSGILTFDADHVRALIEASKASTARRATFAQLAGSSELWRDDLPKERRALLDKELAEEGFALSARETDVDPAKVQPALWLVGDHGVYLMSNAPIDEVKAIREDHVAYAAECDPTKLEFEDWWAVKRTTFGADDGGEAIEISAFEKPLAAGGPIKMLLSPEEMSFLVPTPPNDPSP